MMSTILADVWLARTSAQNRILWRATVYKLLLRFRVMGPRAKAEAKRKTMTHDSKKSTYKSSGLPSDERKRIRVTPLHRRNSLGFREDWRQATGLQSHRRELPCGIDDGKLASRSVTTRTTRRRPRISSTMRSNESLCAQDKRQKCDAYKVDWEEGHGQRGRR